MINMDGNQADEVEVFGLFGGDLPVMHQSRESDCGKWMGNCPHNVPMGAGVELKLKMNVRVEHKQCPDGKMMYIHDCNRNRA
ncbi:hypothetical protein PAECIP112173_05035 [Paenibacillus sp. JJ-100]|uniref:hypothetical protein n=1 Tax=Paenibacillus sp. JJ-100 TaxID=2974896 RepID=UPI0022FFA5A2|nr:hypothetical protein [Paenibacillus sp. JJ-100]CAI6086567.1 hypothetical protein PAECIP112173_05035 [Paenibacillus sp. JJ-100]